MTGTTADQLTVARSAEFMATAIEPPKPSLIRLTGDGGVLIVEIRPDGTVELGPSISTDEAARAFWDAVVRMAGGAL